ncbi:MAG: lysophospholipid acyltransferase family protein [Pseudomonadota bacterium]
MHVIRGILFFLTMSGSAILLSIPLLPFALRSKEGAIKTAKIWVGFVLWSLKVVCGISVQVANPERIPRTGAIVASNHQSMWETLFLFHALPSPVVVAKRELFSIPIFGFWLKRTGAIGIDRTSGAKAVKVLIREAAERVQEGGQLVIFPEGTRANPTEQKELGPGVAAVYGGAGVPCVPVAHNSGEYWLFPGPAKRPGVIDVRIGKPIEAGLPRKEFMEILSREISTLRPDLRPSPTVEFATAS